MAISTYAAGAPAIAGFKIHANDWNSGNTGTQLGASDGFEMLPDGSPRTKTVMAENTSVTGGVGIQKYGIKATESIEGTFKTNAMFAGTQRLIAAWFGADSASALGSGAHSHAITCSANSTAVGNLAWTDNLVCHDIAMTKVKSLGFDWDQGNIGTCEFGIVGKRELVDGTGSNTTVTMASTALPTQPTTKYAQISSSTCTARINTPANGLNAADKVYPSKISLRFERDLQMRYTARNLPYIDEPIVGNWIKVTGTMSFPIAANTTDYPWMVNGTELCLDIAFTGATIGGGYTWKWLLEFPSVNLSTDGLEELNTPDLLTREFQFAAFFAASAPSGMSGVTTPKMTIIDTTSTSHLA